NAWLLIKREDEYATKKDITKEDTSVLSGRSMEQIAQRKDAVWTSNKDLDLSEVPKRKLKSPVSLMKAVLGKESFDNSEWIYEIKWDGYRAIAEIEKNKVQLNSRNNISYNQLFSPIVESLKVIKQEMILDGEVVVVDEKGRAKFQLLQQYKKTRKGNLVYYVFDILSFDGHDLTGLSIVERKELLKKVLPQSSILKISEHIEKDGVQYYKAAKEQGIEGIIAKKIDSKYELGRRSNNWIKIKTKNRQEAIICGYTEPRGGRKLFGALVLGVYKGATLTYIGHTGGGFNGTSLFEVASKMKVLKQKTSPFKNVPKTNTPVTWINPKLVCEVEFSEWTEDGVMRMPIFLGLREDKNPKEVVREMPQNKSQKTNDAGKVQTKNKEIDFTNLKKVFFPQEKITKGDVISYYKEISEFILPHLFNRPHSLLRFPNGINGKSFFQKDMKGEEPDFIQTETVTSDSEGRDVHYLVCKDKASLLYMAQLGCIDMHPWFSTIEDLEKPTYCVLDLDPEEIEFEQVVITALEVHKLLEEIKVPNYIKTSGATGLHIYVPLENKYTYEQSKTFAELLANIVHKRIPKITSVERMPNKRKGKVYLDFLQNRIGQTLASPYSIRPKPGAPVSTPLHWDEVTKKLHPSQFTLKNILKRVEKEGDLFKPTLEKGIEMEKILKSLPS